MAIEGLEIAPNGIGSGLAQVADTRFTQAAFLKNQEQKRLQKAKEEEDFAKSLASIDVDGIHKPDTEDISNEYNNLISKFGNVRNAKTRQERLTAMADYERSKQSLLFDIANSKEFSKTLARVGTNILGSSEDDYDFTQISEFEKLKNSKSKGATIDEYRFIKSAKPEDLLKIDKEIIEASTAPVSAVVKPGEIGGTEGFIREDGKFVRKDLFLNNFNTVVSSKPRYAKAQADLWRSVYEKEKKVVTTNKDNADILKFVAEQKYKLAQASVDEVDQSFSPKGGNMTYNAPGQGPRTSPNFDEPYAGDVEFTTVTRKQTSRGEAVTTSKTKVPVINAYSATVKWESNLISGAINSKNKWIKGVKDQLSLASSDFVILPVVVEDDGSMRAVGISSTITSKVGGQSTTEEVAHKKLTKGKDYQFRVFAMASDNMDRYQVPAESIPYNKMSKEAQAALKAAQEEATRLNGGVQQGGGAPGSEYN